MMELIDTHSHLFLDEFKDDLPLVIERAKEAGVVKIFMPNIDCSTIPLLLDAVSHYKDYCYPMLGLHPTSVDSNYLQELEIMESLLHKENEFIAIGEVGMDLYWDKTFLPEQLDAFERQIEWSIKYHLPLIIHGRDALPEIYSVLKKYKNKSIRGIFHSFTGSIEEAELLMEFKDFKFGINGVVTFKKSILPDVLERMPLERIVLETDSPYLAPVPNRGKRNETAFIKDTLEKLSDIYKMTREQVAEITTKNALDIFNVKNKICKDFKVY